MEQVHGGMNETNKKVSENGSFHSIALHEVFGMLT